MFGFEKMTYKILKKMSGVYRGCLDGDLLILKSNLELFSGVKKNKIERKREKKTSKRREMMCLRVSV